jgi:hypothetical protein
MSVLHFSGPAFLIACFVIIVSFAFALSRGRRRNHNVEHAIKVLNDWCLHADAFTGKYTQHDFDVIRVSYDVCKQSGYGLARLNGGVQQWAEGILEMAQRREAAC